MRMIETVKVTGRQPKPWHKKTNPVWWFLNGDEQPGTVDWYHPEWPHWRRWLYWNVFRNPLQRQSLTATMLRRAGVRLPQSTSLSWTRKESGYSRRRKKAGSVWYLVIFDLIDLHGCGEGVPDQINER